MNWLLTFPKGSGAFSQVPFIGLLWSITLVNFLKMRIWNTNHSCIYTWCIRVILLEVMVSYRVVLLSKVSCFQYSIVSSWPILLNCVGHSLLYLIVNCVWKLLIGTSNSPHDILLLAKIEIELQGHNHHC